MFDTALCFFFQIHQCNILKIDSYSDSVNCLHCLIRHEAVGTLMLIVLLSACHRCHCNPTTDASSRFRCKYVHIMFLVNCGADVL
jgi:hypothetical protein